MKKSRLFNLALLLVCVLCVQTSRAQDDNPFNLPAGALARIGKGAIDFVYGLGYQTLAYSSDGTRLAVASKIGIWLYDAHAGTEVALLTGHTDQVTSVAFAPDGKTIASASYDQTVRVWDVDTGTLKNTLQGHTHKLIWVAFAPDGKTIASASYDGTARLWDVDTGQEKVTLQGHTDGGPYFVTSVAFSPDGKTLAGGETQGSTTTDIVWTHLVRLWDVDTGQAKAAFEGHTDWVFSVAFAPDGKTIASTSEDGMVREWDVESRNLKNTLQDYRVTTWLSLVAFAPDGKTIAAAGGATGNSANTWDIWLWDMYSGGLKNILQGHMHEVSSVTFAPDGKTIASASYDQTIRLWDVDTGEVKATLERPDGTHYLVTSVAFAPDGKTLASASFDQTVRLWDVDSATLKNTLQGHTHEVSSVAFAPDGKILASAGFDRTVRVWDADSGTIKNTLQGHTHEVLSVAFAPDGKILASASEDGTILLWDMSPYITPSIPTAIELSPPLPTQTALLANFPNPFNPDTYIPYQLHSPAQVRLSIYDVRGALVRDLDLGYRAAGQYLTSASAARWDGRDHRGERVSSGVYLYRLQAGPVAHMRKMVLVK